MPPGEACCFRSRVIKPVAKRAGESLGQGSSAPIWIWHPYVIVNVHKSFRTRMTACAPFCPFQYSISEQQLGFCLAPEIFSFGDPRVRRCDFAPKVETGVEHERYAAPSSDGCIASKGPSHPRGEVTSAGASRARQARASKVDTLPLHYPCAGLGSRSAPSRPT